MKMKFNKIIKGEIDYGKKEKEKKIYIRIVKNLNTLKLKSNNIILSFSRGKDSIVAWLLLRELGFNVFPIYYSLCPYMEFELNSLHYYEDYFDTKIIKIPCNTFINLYNNGHLQTIEYLEISKKSKLIEYSTDDIRLMAIKENNLDIDTYIAVGATIYDSLQRRIGINKVDGINNKINKIYPICDFDQKEIEYWIKEYKIKLPIDYKIWGSTFDGLNLRWLEELKNQLPTDYNYIKYFFPLIDAEIIRKQCLNLWDNKNIQKKINKWSKYA